MTTVAPPPPVPAGLGRVLTVPGVYAPRSDSRLLAHAMLAEGVRPGMEVLDVGTGSGVLALYAARLGATVTAVDIDRRAVLTARLNALLARQRVTVRRGDLNRPLLPGRSFDVVVSNPPYVPAPGRLPRRGPARAWDAGHDGRALVDRLCAAAPTVLRPHGVLLMVHSAMCDPEESVRRLSRAGLRAGVSGRASVPFGPVVRGRLDWLRQRGLMDVRDEREELVVIRAERV
ncbi:HemK2/MTQ2 family protein methyltransferase [Streptomyces sp. NRRL F-5135]|uniref:HemK2/MTQ2 family protein methyltransferase n=1 Tax=Streptomyces sp. NRRL F-5135 TaxID=1463858 RepID=UPI0004C82A6E|nr:HemK2/MTQ2 family protein methyltransferase [Streptomyces sp. NRRL F-5135]